MLFRSVRQITPLVTQHSVLKFSDERALKRQQHWQGIAQAACAQSGHDLLPIIDKPLSWQAWITAWAAPQPTVLAMLSLREEARPWRDHWPNAPESACVLSGPEGGLSDQEALEAMAIGFVPVSLGSAVLRAETAPLVALSQWL